MRYIKKYTNETDVQTDLNNEVLGKPYVAYITSGSSLDWNSKDVENYIGVWSNPSVGSYQFTITDTGSTAWADGVIIAVIPDAFINENQYYVNVKLTYDSNWVLRLDATDQEQSDYDEFNLGEFSESGDGTTQFVKIGVSASMSESIEVSWNTQGVISFIATNPSEPLEMNTINPEE